MLDADVFIFEVYAICCGIFFCCHVPVYVFVGNCAQRKQCLAGETRGFSTDKFAGDIARYSDCFMSRHCDVQCVICFSHFALFSFFETF